MTSALCRCVALGMVESWIVPRMVGGVSGLRLIGDAVRMKRWRLPFMIASAT